MTILIELIQKAVPLKAGRLFVSQLTVLHFNIICKTKFNALLPRQRNFAIE